MDIETLRGELQEQLRSEPQKLGNAMLALAEIERGLGELAKLGQRLTLDKYSAGSADKSKFPMMLYRGSEPRVVKNAAEEASARKEGFKILGEANETMNTVVPPPAKSKSK